MAKPILTAVKIRKLYWITVIKRMATAHQVIIRLSGMHMVIRRVQRH